MNARMLQVEQRQAKGKTGFGIALVVTVLSAGAQWLVGLPLAMSALDPQDEEGYALTLLRLSSEGHALASEMYTDRGPLWHWLWNLVFDATGMDYTLGNGRYVTLATCIFAAIFLALAVNALTGSVFALVISQWAGFVLLTPVMKQPMSPDALVAVLLAALAWVLCLPTHRWWRWCLVGTMSIALLLVKFEFGILVLIGVVLSMLPRVAQLRARPWLLWPMALIVVAPAVAFSLSNIWLVLVSLLSLLLIVGALQRLPVLNSDEVKRAVFGLLAGAALGICALVLVALLRDSRLSSLWVAASRGVLSPAESFQLPLVIPSAVALAVLSGLILYTVARLPIGGSNGKRWSKVGVALGLSALVLAAAWLSPQGQLVTQRSKDAPLNYSQSMEIAQNTKADDGIVILGCGWSSEVLYFADRRGLMLQHDWPPSTESRPLPSNWLGRELDYLYLCDPASADVEALIPPGIRLEQVTPQLFRFARQGVGLDSFE